VVVDDINFVRIVYGICDGKGGFKKSITESEKRLLNKIRKMSKYIFITGINGNLAKRILCYLSIQNEYKVVGCDIHSEYDARTMDSIGLGLEFYLECDIRCENSIKATIDILRERDIFPTVLINNAAVDSVPVKNDRTTGLEMDNFSDIINVNLKAPILFSKYCSEYWIQMR